jgi:hypothetical protein
LKHRRDLRGRPFAGRIDSVGKGRGKTATGKVVVEKGVGKAKPLSRVVTRFRMDDEPRPAPGAVHAESTFQQAKEDGSMAKVKKGDSLSCKECGLVVTVDEACGCATADLIMCCDKPMARGKAAATQAKKKAGAKKPAAKAKPAKAAAKAKPAAKKPARAKK